MPKLKRTVSLEQERWEKELRARYGGMMTKRQIGIELGHANNQRWSRKFVEDLRAYGSETDAFKRYKVSDVAAKICATL